MKNLRNCIFVSMQILQKQSSVVIDSKAQLTKRIQEGYTYQQERNFDVVQKVAGNEAVGEFSGMAIGLGMIAGMGGTVRDWQSGKEPFSGITEQQVSTQPQAAEMRICF